MHEVSSGYIVLVYFLTMCDFGVAVIWLPNAFLRHGGAAFDFKLPLSLPMCNLVLSNMFFIICGWLSFAMIALMRCMAVLNPRSVPFFSFKRVTFVVIPLMVAFAFAVLIPFFFEVKG